MMLDKRPDLTLKLRKMADSNQGEERKTLVESTAECIQRAFTMCLTERSANRNGIGRDGLPEGKKIGIYCFANMVLKLLFQVTQFQSLLSGTELIIIEVSENSLGESTIHEHHPTFPSTWTLPCKSARNLPILPWPLPVLQQSFLPRATSPTISIRPMPCTMYTAEAEYPNTSIDNKFDTGSISFQGFHLTTRSSGSPAKICADLESYPKR